MKTLALDQKGFSLVGVMVGIGVSAIMGLALMTMTDNMATMQASWDVQTDVQQEAYFLRASLADEHTCVANFAGRLPTTTATALESTTGLRVPTSKTSIDLGPTYLLPSQDPANSSLHVKLDRITLRRYAADSNLVVVGLEYKPKNAKLFGGALRPREVPLNAIFKADGTIETCSAGIAEGPPNPTPTPGTGSKQGTACGAPPYRISNYFVPGESVDHADITEPGPADYKQAIDGICDQQTYPLTTGMKISGQKIYACQVETKPKPGEVKGASGPVRRNCLAIIALGASENAPGCASAAACADRVLKNRNGYKNADECKKQKTFSEGDVIRFPSTASIDPDKPQHVCVNGHWISLTNQGGDWAWGAASDP